MKSKAVRTSCIESASVDCIETALKVHQKTIWSSLNLESPYVIKLIGCRKGIHAVERECSALSMAGALSMADVLPSTAGLPTPVLLGGCLDLVLEAS